MIVIGKLIQLNFLVYIVIHVEQIVWTRKNQYVLMKVGHPQGPLVQRVISLI